METVVKGVMPKALTMFAAFLLCVIALTACGGGGSQQVSDLSSGGEQQASGETAPAQSAGSVEVKASVDDYSWAELKVIASEIAAAGDEAAAVEVAKQYNLVGPNGQLDGTQIKMVGWQGSQVPVQIIGFAHDDKSDGTGKAGITFQFVDCIGKMAMNTTGTNDGGWEACELRSWLNSEFVSKLSEDLAASIVTVDKSTNNVGATQDTSAVTTTQDAIWLPSFKELCGDLPSDDTFEDYEGVGFEGNKYKLYRDLNVSWEVSNNILRKTLQGNSLAGWFTRSPDPAYSENFMGVSSDGYVTGMGEPGFSINADGSYGVAPCFCI